jgi:gluconokinase
LNNTFVLALDIGTSSVRSALYDCDGNVLPKTMVKNERLLAATEDGGAEIDANLAFEQVVAAIDDVLVKAKNVKGYITHVAASSFWHSLVGIDAKGKPTTKVFGWADTRSRDYVEKLRGKFDESAVHNRTGARFHSSFWPAKLLWLQNEYPEVFAKTDKWLSLSDFVALNLFGIPATSVSMASATGIFDIRECRWDDHFFRPLKINSDKLPDIAADSDSFRLTPAFANRWPRIAEAKWLPAIGDGAANNIGAGCVTRSKAALMIGTSGAMRVAYKGDPPKTMPQGLWCYRIDRRRVIMGGALSDGGGLYHWLKENLRLTGTDNQIEKEITQRVPDGHGLTFLPFLAGERSTGYHESAQGAVIGLRTATEAVDILQAALESVAYRFAEIFDQINSTVKVKEIIASGGALRESPVWTQMIADVLARDMSLPDTREASSRGAVLLALEAMGKLESIEKTQTPKGQVFKFNKKRNAVYRRARIKHAAYYDSLIK